MTASPRPASFRLGYVPGVIPGKWVRIWDDRVPGTPLRLIATDVAQCAAAIGDGTIDMAVTRLPDALRATPLGPHHTIELYEETTVVVVPKDHFLTLADEITVSDLASEPILWPLDEPLEFAEQPGLTVDYQPETTSEAVELVAAGTGLLVVPQSLARLHHRKDLVYRRVTGVPTSIVGLLWPDPTTELADEFIGIVRGRTASSSRGSSTPTPKRSAKEKAAARRAAREAAGKVPRRRRRP